MLNVRCLLLAQADIFRAINQCPLLGVKRTPFTSAASRAIDPSQGGNCALFYEFQMVAAQSG
jgi:hypothetical protein